MEALVRALGFGPRDEPDAPVAAPAAPAATANEIQAGRRVMLERLSRHEVSAQEAAEAIRALGRNVR